MPFLGFSCHTFGYILLCFCSWLYFIWTKLCNGLFWSSFTYNNIVCNVDVTPMQQSMFWGLWVQKEQKCMTLSNCLGCWSCDKSVLIQVLKLFLNCVAVVQQRLSWTVITFRLRLGQQLFLSAQLSYCLFVEGHMGLNYFTQYFNFCY